jgi:CIC family chloride channel protein
MKNKKFENYHQIQLDALYQVKRTIYVSLLCLLVGAISAFGAIGFKYLIEFFRNLLFHGTLSFSVERAHYSSRYTYLVIIIPAVGITIANWITTKWAPEAKGHGVPEVMAAVLKRDGKIRGQVALVKTLASAITIGAGGSVGKEGPIVQIGAGFGSTLAQAFKLTSRETIILVGAGVAGGISATFNAPIGGIMFALELILPEYSIMTIMPLVVSAVTSTAVATLFTGIHPAFNIPPYTLNSPYELFFYAILGIAAGFLSVAFIKLVYRMEDLVNSIKVHFLVKTTIGGIIVGLIGFLCFNLFGSYYIFGVGYDFIDVMLDNQITLLWVALLLIILKLVANSVTLATGGSGGIFAPSLFLGSALGGAFGIIVNKLLPNISGSIAAYAIVGMAAMVSGVTGGVLTAIIMVFEMTRNYAVMLPLMLSSVIAFLSAKLLYKETMYTEKLTRRGIQVDFDKQLPLLKNLNVTDIMKKELISCKSDELVESVLEKMHTRKLGLLPVIDNKKIIGTVGYAQLYGSSNATVATHVEKKEITIPKYANLWDALKIMRKLKSNILIVCDEDEIVGFITANSIFWTYMDRRERT